MFAGVLFFNISQVSAKICVFQNEIGENVARRNCKCKGSIIEWPILLN